MDPLSVALFDEATRTAVKSLKRIPEGLWGAQPGKRFGIGELAVHNRMSERFALKFLMAAAGAERFELHPAFTGIVAMTDPVARHRALSALNLDAARRVCTQFASLSDLQQWWVKDRSSAIHTLTSTIPDHDDIVWREVSHPLVPNLVRPWIVMCHILFTLHPIYHTGQLTAEMKVGGYADLVPFPFGEFTAEEAALLT